MNESDTVVIIPGSDTNMYSSKKAPLEKRNISPGFKHEVVRFAETLVGIPYKFASTDPSEGFDCSGFITYVFNHFNVAVPRSSVDFTNMGEQIDQMNAKEGDLILFTGTNDSIKIVGHMGIITENTDTLKFIHSTSGRANGVTISNFSEHYKKRFVKIIRIFPD
ncbi:MAG: C40 family peptidase [Ferruginibacter sp.]